MSMLEARERQSEVIEPVIERHACDGDAKCRHCGEVGQAHSSRRVLLPEHHISVRAVERAPSPDAALQGATDSHRHFRMATADLLEDRHRPDARSSLKHRHDLAVPHAGERVRTATPTRLLFPRWQARVGLNPIRGGGGKPGLRSRDGGAIGLTGLHVQPRLAVGDMSARQALILLMMKNHMLRPTAPTASHVRPPGENAPPGMG